MQHRNNPKKAIVLSLRAKWCAELFSGRKRIEYRKFFPLDFSGKVYVYECGPDSRHQVIGVYRTDRIALWKPEYLDNEERMQQLVECFEYAGAPDSELEELCAEEDGTLACIPVLEPKLLKQPLTLSKFSVKYKTEPFIGHPPMSWQKVTIDADVPDDTIDSVLEKGAKTDSVAWLKKNRPETKKNEQTDLFGGLPK